jgi:hypothetical protein
MSSDVLRKGGAQIRPHPLPPFIKSMKKRSSVSNKLLTVTEVKVKVKVKVNLSLCLNNHHDMKTLESGGRAPYILDLDSRRR